jgi:hypothetical protein
MLTISLERVMELLDKADEIELPEPALRGEAAEGVIDDADAIDELLADDPAYRRLAAAVAALTPSEAYDLLALALLEQNSAELDEWQAMLERARDVAEDEMTDQIIETLVLTDDIVLALERLGYIIEDEAVGAEKPDEPVAE